MSENAGQSLALWATVLTAVGTLATLITKWWLAKADRGEAEVMGYRTGIQNEVKALREHSDHQDEQILQLIQEKGECMRELAVLKYQVADLQAQLKRLGPSDAK
jgi:uncharacterized protein (DUF3084 family)